MPSGSDAESDTGIRLLLWGELEAAAEHLTNALELFAALDAVWWECLDLILLASVRRQQGRTAEANAALHAPEHSPTRCTRPTFRRYAYWNAAGSPAPMATRSGTRPLRISS
jgi:hypothetical protein